ncbi:50S ribosomal protein L6 [Candidatus Microgenomates bacterium]|nr:50S ribosomal protein L6 [Candidatus Microgenomates bacterium]
MSRIGSKPVKVPEGVTIKIDKSLVEVTGPKGTLSQTFRPEVAFRVDGGNILVERLGETPKAKSLHGLSRTLIENMILGVTAGWNKGLELVGVGYRATVEGETLVLNVGFSHQVKFPAPVGVTFTVNDNTKINVAGSNKQLVGETAAQIRRIRPPEPYKGKGIRYIGEVIRRKAGKAAAKTAGATGAGGGAK